MAVGTAEKRRAVSGIGWLLPGVTPNAAKDEEWRREVGWSCPFDLSLVVDEEVDLNIEFGGVVGMSAHSGRIVFGGI